MKKEKRNSSLGRRFKENIQMAMRENLIRLIGHESVGMYIDIYERSLCILIQNTN